MPPKKGPRKSMPGGISRAQKLAPSRRSPRVPPQNKSLDSSPSSPTKTLPIATASPPDNSFNFRFYTPKPASPSLRTPGKSVETSSPHRKAFQPRPTRLSNVYTPTAAVPATTHGSRRSKRTNTLETPKKQVLELSEPEIPDSVESSGSYLDVGTKASFGTKEDTKALSSSPSTPDMRNSSRVRKPTRQAIESQETSKRGPRRKNTSAPAPTVDKDAKVAKGSAAKKPTLKTRTSKRTANTSTQNDSAPAVMDANMKAGVMLLRRIFDEINDPNFVPPPDAHETLVRLREDFYRREREEKAMKEKAMKSPVVQSGEPNDIEMVDQDASEAPEFSLSSSTPALATTINAGMLGFRKRSETTVSGDGWVETGYVNPRGESLTIMPAEFEPFIAFNSYGYKDLPFPPVRVQSTQQAVNRQAFGFPPPMGHRNIPAGVATPFVVEDVQAEMALFASTSTAAPAVSSNKKPRARKRRATEAISAGVVGDEASASTPVQPAAPGERKSQRRRRQTDPAPAAAVPSPSPPTAPKGSAAVSDRGTEGNKPKVQQRLRLTLKPAKEAMSSPASSSAGSPAKRRGRRG
ncbi:unnamed protein product [Penicillium salamii]|uniref:Uncharacterized protein n=1 Tax=Penicillium salamii TaxID=1612424 RepID=A0A9W4J4F1_9EURO|nr:unnamed protein product [Penicillium salamii]